MTNCEYISGVLVVSLEPIKTEEKPKNFRCLNSDNTSATLTIENAKQISLSIPSSSSDCCKECKIHRSWLAAAMMAKVCKQIKIRTNQFSAGAVPSAHNDWRNLLEFRLTSPQGEDFPCARCETAICSCLSIFGQGSASLDFAPEKLRPNCKSIFQRCASIDDERMARILFDGLPEKSAGGNEDCSSSGGSSTTAITNNDLPNKGVSCTPETEPQTHISHKISPSLKWLLALDVKVALAIASVVLGYQELISIVKESSLILKALLPEHFTALSLLCAREQSMKKDRINSKVITDVLQQLDLSNLISVNSCKNSPGKRDMHHKQTPMYSWIIDCNSSCLICTLSLRSEIDNKDLAVTSFVCDLHHLIPNLRYGIDAMTD
ncbi:hypothetical protein NECAME_16476 [Necator americanus]|uniref:Uncharacterized protein n=1 Tax=Necator americanus TaxID=51031 RepID=W2TWR6_NECAM|nr:hypothetical protein NECAME_16476 [Necator americanus]ETN86124.1 hypothetical protein NECAME_16476 [Necator americanus]